MPPKDVMFSVKLRTIFSKKEHICQGRRLHGCQVSFSFVDDDTKLLILTLGHNLRLIVKIGHVCLGRRRRSGFQELNKSNHDKES